MKKILWKI